MTSYINQTIARELINARIRDAESVRRSRLLRAPEGTPPPTRPRSRRTGWIRLAAAR